MDNLITNLNRTYAHQIVITGLALAIALVLACKPLPKLTIEAPKEPIWSQLPSGNVAAAPVQTAQMPVQDGLKVVNEGKRLTQVEQRLTELQNKLTNLGTAHNENTYILKAHKSPSELLYIDEHFLLPSPPKYVGQRK